MIEGLNVMERLGHMMTNKNSRICVEFNIDAIPKSFREKFNTEDLRDEIVYEYAVSYLQIIADIVPAVKIVAKERNSIYWHIAELAKKLGLFVICEIEQEEVSYIIENKTKMVAENRGIDAVIINIDLNDNDNLEILHFLEILKEAKKGVFVRVKEVQKNSKNRWWKVFSKRAQKTLRQQFSPLQNIEKVCYDEMGRPTYSMVGVCIETQRDYEFLNTYTFSLIFNHGEKINEIGRLFDGEGQGALVVINFANNMQENWAEALVKEVTQKNKRLNNAINEFYEIEEF